MEVQVGGRVADVVLVVFGVVPGVEREGALAERAVQVLDLVAARRFGHDDHGGLDEFLPERRRLPDEAFDRRDVVLCQHRRDRIPLGAEFEEREIVQRRVQELLRRQAGVDV